MEGDGELILYRGRSNRELGQSHSRQYADLPFVDNSTHPELPGRPSLMVVMNNPSQISSHPLPSFRELVDITTATQTARVMASNINRTSPLGAGHGTISLQYNADILPKSSIGPSPFGMLAVDRCNKSLLMISIGAIGSGRSSSTQVSPNNTRSETISTRDIPGARGDKRQPPVHPDFSLHQVIGQTRLTLPSTASTANSAVAVVPGSSPIRLDPTRMFIPGHVASTPGAAAIQTSFSTMFRMANFRNDTELIKKRVQEMQRVAINNGVVLTPFRPSNSALMNVHGTDTELGIREGRRHTYSQFGVSNRSVNYRGDLNILSNQSAKIDANENCSTWVVGLPGNVTHTTLLDAIRGIGKIYAVVINPPTARFGTAAAKIVFLNRPSAEAFMRLAADGFFRVMGTQVRNVRWNEIRSARHYVPEQSRAIRITAPASLMNFDFFEAYFPTRFTYELDCKGVVPCNIPGYVSHEWHFGSLRCQSAWAKKAIEQEFRGIYQVVWAQDPCEQLSPMVPNMWYV